MRVSRHDSVGLIVDIQERLFPHIHQHEKLEKNTKILIQGLQLLQIPVLITQQYTQGLGQTIPSVAEHFNADHFIEKNTFSCCDESNFLAELNRLNKKFVIIAGIEAHVCVLQTVPDLVDNGFVPVVVEDCVSSRKENDKKVAVERIRQEGGMVTTYESILLELCRVAGNETFKAISRLIK
ncbi:MAG: isochorismatase family protein [Cyclobacteriaceae bacterium]|nr:isochorismatase family protein [Cyclobacteriaceae bacterium]